jgi:hypothetical protein
LLDNPHEPDVVANSLRGDSGCGQIVMARMSWRGQKVLDRQNPPPRGYCCESGIFVRPFKQQTY